MEFSWEYSCEGVDWQELSDLYKIAPLGEKPANDLKVVFNNSRYVCFAYIDARIVAVGRALSDGLDCSYICDVAVHPEAQGNGLGKKVIQELVQLSKDHKKILLYAKPGKEGFYQKLGFGRMATAMGIFSNQEQAIEAGLIDPKT